MALISFFSMWLAVLALSVFFACRRAGGCSAVCVKDKDAYAAGAAIPLYVVCGVILVLFACGCVGILHFGAWLVLAAGVAVAGWLAVAGLRQCSKKETALQSLLKTKSRLNLPIFFENQISFILSSTQLFSL